MFRFNSGSVPPVRLQRVWHVPDQSGATPKPENHTYELCFATEMPGRGPKSNSHGIWRAPIRMGQIAIDRSWDPLKTESQVRVSFGHRGVAILSTSRSRGHASDQTYKTVVPAPARSKLGHLFLFYLSAERFQQSE